MKLDKNKKAILGIFVIMVVIVLFVLWVSGVFGGSGFGRVNRFVSGFGRVNRSRSGFGRIINRSRFGALGVPDNSGPVLFAISYTNPKSFGTYDGNQSIWNGLVFSLSTTDNPTAISGPNTNTIGSILTKSNPFYLNKYKKALIDYYGNSYNPTGDYTPDNEDYIKFTQLSYASKEKLRYIIIDSLSQNPIILTRPNRFDIADLDIPPTEQPIFMKEIYRLLKFATAFRNSTDFSDITNATPSPATNQLTNGAYEGVYLDNSIGSVVNSEGQTVNIVTVKQPDWLNFKPTTFNFGVGIINSNLTYKTSESKIFPFMISDIDETTVTIGGSSTSGNPSGLTVTARYW